MNPFWNRLRESLSPLPVLHTERLTLRAARMSDARDLFAYSKDPEVARHVLWDAHQNMAQTRAYIRFLQHQYRTGAPSTYVIVWKETGQVIGTIGFMWLQRENRAAEVGYSLSRDFWNRGIMTEALKRVLRHGFDAMNLNRIEAMFETDNPASGHVMLHAGMRREGCLRQRVYNKGRYADVELYAILYDDYERSGGANP